jgi:dTDP-4-dehydrorhamnose reductase
MRVLVIGAEGMLGHKLVQALRGTVECAATVRGTATRFPELYEGVRLFTGVDVCAADRIGGVLATAPFDAVVNCAGVTKQVPAGRDPVATIETNALFPHRLARLCGAGGVRLVHISTDCVFSGRQGSYREEDPPDPDDLYGRSKLLGEVDAPGCLTIRTSMIGRELKGSHGLLEWFLGQTGPVRGFRRAIFSGLTTGALAGLIVEVLQRHTALTGLYHVAAEPISKYDLLSLVNASFRTTIDIVPDDTVRIDRSLDGRRFRQATGFVAPPWRDMIAAASADPTPYAQWRYPNAV